MTSDLPVRFDENGLIPVVVRDSESGDVLMLGFMNEEALKATRLTGRSHFWSRSRQKLWKKGETSGHEQIVDDILVNCEQNCLLMNVRQIGAVCHDGYESCFYRRLEPDGSLAIQRKRAFDPATVYGWDIESLSREWFGAYQYLGEHDLRNDSSTSARVHDPKFDSSPRIADELRELAGVLSGTHSHSDPTQDALLEGTQALYWLALAAAKLGLSWDDIRPDRALQTGEEEFNRAFIAKMLIAEADRASFFDAASIHAAMALVAQGSLLLGVTARELLQADLDDLKSKPYLEAYFSSRSTA